MHLVNFVRRPTISFGIYIKYNIMSIKKIGIITFYYNSINYGGVLQSYALESFLVKNGYEKTEQICYKSVQSTSLKKLLNLKKVIRYISNKIEHRKFSLRYEKSLSDKRESFKDFTQNVIRHSDYVYNVDNINVSIGKYDVFITGSDQVWNTDNYDFVYRLDFVPQNNVKIAYAAGISNEKLTKKQKEIFINSLRDFTAVSVREKKAVSLLQPLTDKTVEWVIDPTLLLTDKQWNEVCSQRKVQEKYLFCYFLGDPLIKVKNIIEFANRNGLKIVNFPYACGTSSSKSDFGDYRVYDASPQDFLSYVKHAEYVFTDSFHASVFSHIYKRNFFVFNRKGFKAMNDRIYSLTDLFDTGDRFCDSKEKCTLEYIESLPPINYDREFPKFEAMKEKSINFLKDNLKKAEEKLNGVD